LLVSELFANSVRRSGSGAPGETVTVAMATDIAAEAESADQRRAADARVRT
jgi:hypothetical protein